MPTDSQAPEGEIPKAPSIALPVQFLFNPGPGKTGNPPPSTPPFASGAPATGGTRPPVPVASGAAGGTAGPFASGAAPTSSAPAQQAAGAAGANPTGTRAPFPEAAAEAPPITLSPGFSPGRSAFSGRGLVRLAKLCIAAGILLGGVFFFMRGVLPVMKELSNPGQPASKSEEKPAPSSVQIIRQTREVVAKGDSNVAYLNAIIEGKDAPEVAAKPAEALPPPPPPRPPEPEVKINLKAANRFVDELMVSGVIGGVNPKIIVNGLLVKVDDVVDPRLGLIFAGVDEMNRVILFRHKDGTLVRRKY